MNSKVDLRMPKILNRDQKAEIDRLTKENEVLRSQLETEQDL